MHGGTSSPGALVTWRKTQKPHRSLVNEFVNDEAYKGTSVWERSLAIGSDDPDRLVGEGLSPTGAGQERRPAQTILPEVMCHLNALIVA